jgi:hypothetical protein
MPLSTFFNNGIFSTIIVKTATTATTSITAITTAAKIIMYPS